MAKDTEDAEPSKKDIDSAVTQVLSLIDTGITNLMAEKTLNEQTTVNNNEDDDSQSDCSEAESLLDEYVTMSIPSESLNSRQTFIKDELNEYKRKPIPRSCSHNPLKFWQK